MRIFSSTKNVKVGDVKRVGGGWHRFVSYNFVVSACLCVSLSLSYILEERFVCKKKNDC